MINTHQYFLFLKVEMSASVYSQRNLFFCIPVRFSGWLTNTMPSSLLMSAMLQDSSAKQEGE